MSEACSARSRESSRAPCYSTTGRRTRPSAAHVDSVILHKGRELDTSTPEGRLRLSELIVAAIRARTCGMSLPAIAKRLEVSEDVAASLLAEGLDARTKAAAAEIRGRQQQLLHDIYAALTPGLTRVDLETGVPDYADRVSVASQLVQTAKYEAELHGVRAPKRVEVREITDAEFTTTVSEDLAELGVDPRGDVPLSPVDGWSNT